MKQRMSAFACMLVWMCCLPTLAAPVAIPWEAYTQQLENGGSPLSVEAMLAPSQQRTAAVLSARPLVWSEDRVRAFDFSLLVDDVQSLQSYATAFNGEVHYRTHPEWIGGETLSFSNTGLVYESVRGRQAALCALPWDYGQLQLTEPDVDRVPNLQTLSFAQAMAMLEPIADALGLTLGTPSHLMVWEYEAIQRAQDSLGDLAKQLDPRLVRESWRPEDAFYFIRVPIYVQGIRMMPDSIALSDQRYIYRAVIECIIDADGIQRFEWTGGNFDSVAPAGPPQPMLSAGEALEELAKSAPMAEQIQSIGRIMLQYLPMEKGEGASYELIPAWCFYDGNGRKMAVHALTGDRIF